MVIVVGVGVDEEVGEGEVEGGEGGGKFFLCFFFFSFMGGKEF